MACLEVIREQNDDATKIKESTLSLKRFAVIEETLRIYSLAGI